MNVCIVCLVTCEMRASSEMDSSGLVPNTPDWFSPNCLPHDFDPAAACPLWLRFLGEVSEDDGDWIDALDARNPSFRTG